jgi:hypothetical protein
MEHDRKIATVTFIFCVLVLVGRLASAEIFEVDALFYAGEVSSNSLSICNYYVCVQPISYPAFYVISPYIVASQSSYTIHLEQGWNFISIPLEVSR